MDAPKNFGPDSPPQESMEIRRENFLKLREFHTSERALNLKESGKSPEVHEVALSDKVIEPP